MKIDNSLASLANLEIKKAGEPPAARAAAETETRPPEARPEGARPSEARPGDVVKLSERARLAARATELAQAAPEVRQDKVADLRARLGAGTYNVSGRVVAESLLRKSITEV